MSIQSEINRITGEVSTQGSGLADIESQLAQALTLLDGKAAGGGGSGGSAVETCEVEITVRDVYGGGIILSGFIYTSLENGSLVTKRVVVKNDFEEIVASTSPTGYDVKYKGVIHCVVGTKIIGEDYNLQYWSANPILSSNIIADEMWGAFEDMPTFTIVSGSTGQITVQQ